MNKDLIISSERFVQLNSYKKILLIDLSEREKYQQGTVLAALNMPYESLVSGELPHPSMLPPAEKFAQALAKLGYKTEQHIVAFDDEFGLKAARLYWTMRMADLRGFSYLNGGLTGWLAAGNQASFNKEEPVPVEPLSLTFSQPYRALFDDILSSLDEEKFFLWDTRSQAEFTGEDVRAQKGGHIPGARHLEWLELLDDKGLVRSPEEVSSLLKKFIHPAQEKNQPIVAYCQGHRRSAMAFMLADYGGVTIKGYDGSWQEWGNRDESVVS